MPDRYQNQPWYIRLWRRRWYLAIPYWTLLYWGNRWSDGEITDFHMARKLAVGQAQRNMKWWYTMEECGLRFSEKFAELEEDEEDSV